MSQLFRQHMPPVHDDICSRDWVKFGSYSSVMLWIDSVLHFSPQLYVSMPLSPLIKTIPRTSQAGPPHSWRSTFANIALPTMRTTRYKTQCGLHWYGSLFNQHRWVYIQHRVPSHFKKSFIWSRGFSNFHMSTDWFWFDKKIRTSLITRAFVIL